MHALNALSCCNSTYVYVCTYFIADSDCCSHTAAAVVAESAAVAVIIDDKTDIIITFKNKCRDKYHSQCNM
jgi:hypothetical protein